MSKSESKTDKIEKTVRKTTGNITDTAREIWLAGLGALSAVEEEGTRFYSNLVDKGSEFEKKGKKQVDSFYHDVNDRYKDLEKKIVDTFVKAEDTVEDNMAQLVKKMGVPSREEVRELSRKVERLMTKVDELTVRMNEKEAKATAPKSPAATTAKTAPKAPKTRNK